MQPQSFELTHDADGVLGVVHRDALSDLEFQRILPQPRVPYRVFDRAHQPMMKKLAARQVDGDVEIDIVQALPLAYLIDRVAPHSLAELHDEYRRFCLSDEGLRGREGRVALRPAAQRFQTDG